MHRNFENGFRDRIEANGQRVVIVDGEEYPNFVKYGGRPLGMERDAQIARPVQRSAIATGGVDPHVRIQDMDREGIDIAVLYPSGTTSMCAVQDPYLESALYQAYNRWLYRLLLALSQPFKRIGDDFYASPRIRRCGNFARGSRILGCGHFDFSAHG
uniref:Uncharacterized protein n=1 Tax=Desertifilum tharense IPPAS B-1220 TaxID=1781255 RepID=A0ACD5GRL1_9CYAN